MIQIFPADDDSDTDTSPPPLHSVREKERDAKLLQNISKDLNWTTESILEDQRQLDEEDKTCYQDATNEGTADTFEWVDFKRSGQSIFIRLLLKKILNSISEGLPSGVILATESLKDHFEDSKDYEAVQLLRYQQI